MPDSVTAGPVHFVINLPGPGPATATQRAEVVHSNQPTEDAKPVWTLALVSSAKGHNIEAQVRFASDDPNVVSAMMDQLLTVAATGQTGAALLADLARALAEDAEGGQVLAAHMAAGAKRAMRGEGGAP